MEDIYLECISKNDKKEIEFRTTNNEIFSYQTIIYIMWLWQIFSRRS